MAGLSLSGLASGMDTDSVIQQLMAVESQGKTRLQGQQYQAEGRKAALDQIGSQLRLLKSTIDDLRSVGTWLNVQNVSTTDPNKVAATFHGGAAVGSYSVAVTQLARADQRFYDYTPPAAASKLTIGYAGDTTTNVDVDIAAGASVSDVAAAINAKATSPAFAAVVNGQLVLSGKKTGVNLNVTTTDLTEDATKRRDARSAQWSIDGVPQPDSLSNTVTNGLAGIDLTFKALTTDPVTVNVGAPGPDQTAMQTKIKTFVDTYNATIDMVKGKLEEQPVQSPSTSDDYAKGVLRGDPGLTSLLSQLRNAMSSTYSGDPASPNPTSADQLMDIGISVPSAQTSGAITDDRLDGKLTFDTSKLTDALSNDPVAVRRLFGGLSSTSGFTQALDNLLDPVSNASTGSIAQRSSQADSEIADIKSQESDMDLRLQMKQDRLKAQFTAMETALSQSQSQQSWLSGQISSL